MEAYIENFLDEVTSESRLLGLSGYTLWQRRKHQVEEHARAILSYLRHRKVLDPIRRYVRRNDELRLLQEEFERTGRYATTSVGDVHHENREIYDLSLLLSCLLTAHRFETVDHLAEFFAMPTRAPSRLLSVGYGTGYELHLAIERLPQWRIEGYESSHGARDEAIRLLDYFGHATACLRFGGLPLEDDVNLAPWRDRYGKVVYCELLEHLERPDRALANLRQFLHPDGQAFLTMAVNIAQEDHVYHYRDLAQCREQLRDAGLRIDKEWISPVTVQSIPELERERRFRKGNYIAVVARDEVS